MTLFPIFPITFLETPAPFRLYPRRNLCLTASIEVTDKNDPGRRPRRLPKSQIDLQQEELFQQHHPLQVPDEQRAVMMRAIQKSRSPYFIACIETKNEPSPCGSNQVHRDGRCDNPRMKVLVPSSRQKVWSLQRRRRISMLRKRQQQYQNLSPLLCPKSWRNWHRLGRNWKPWSSH